MLIVVCGCGWSCCWENFTRFWAEIFSGFDCLKIIQIELVDFGGWSVWGEDVMNNSG